MATRKHGTASGTSADVTLTGVADSVEVASLGTNPIYFTIDGVTTPTVKGDDTYVAPAGGSYTVEVKDYDGTVVVKLISAGTPDYYVGFLNVES